MDRRELLAAALVLASVFAIGIVVSAASGPLLWFADPAEEPMPGATAGHPTELAIPALAVQAPVRAVGLADDGAIAAPDLARAHETGWYEDGPSPGQYGAAVIVGHVDDHAGPAVFHHLPELAAGDRVEVTLRDERVATFEVTQIRRYDRFALPPEVYGDFSRPELRLITCGGSWQGAAGYSQSVVVFATLV